MTTTDLQYPVGKFQRPAEFNAARMPAFIDTIASFPEKLKATVLVMSEAQLNAPYRPGGWSVRQVVHHCADSHMNSFIRFKLGLTEDNPTIKPYEEAAWAEMSDYLKTDIAYSLMIIEGLHERLTSLLRNMSEADFQRTVFHPQQNREMSLFTLLALYAWHCDHHLAHVQIVSRQ